MLTQKVPLITAVLFWLAKARQNIEVTVTIKAVR